LSQEKRTKSKDKIVRIKEKDTRLHVADFKYKTKLTLDPVKG
jgi:hypothetical protein